LNAAVSDGSKGQTAVVNQASGYEGIVVLGFPRSGTTLLRRLLDAHPEISCPPETHLLSAAARFLDERPFAGALSVGVLPGLDFCGIDENTTLSRLRDFVFSFLRELRDRAGKTVWAEKTPWDAFHVSAIERLCVGHCRFIIVLRHPLDVVCSTKGLADRMGTYVPELHDYVRRFPAPLEAFAHAWVDVNDALVRFMHSHPDVCTRVKYEELIHQPAETLRTLFEFLDRPTDVEQLMKRGLDSADTPGLGDWKTYQTQALESGSIGRWKSLSRDVVEKLWSIVNRTMQSVGYEPIEDRLPADDEAESKRLREISRMVAQAALKRGQGDRR
jgi:protein-tyrosine sulfotransferase